MGNSVQILFYFYFPPIGTYQMCIHYTPVEKKDGFFPPLKDFTIYIQDLIFPLEIGKILNIFDSVDGTPPYSWTDYSVALCNQAHVKVVKMKRRAPASKLHANETFYMQQNIFSSLHTSNMALTTKPIVTCVLLFWKHASDLIFFDIWIQDTTVENWI